MKASDGSLWTFQSE